jgi:hypothetical protein
MVGPLLAVLLLAAGFATPLAYALTNVIAEVTLLGEPSILVLLPSHAIAKGCPANFIGGDVSVRCGRSSIVGQRNGNRNWIGKTCAKSIFPDWIDCKRCLRPSAIKKRNRQLGRCRRSQPIPERETVFCNLCERNKEGRGENHNAYEEVRS